MNAKNTTLVDLYSETLDKLIKHQIMLGENIEKQSKETYRKFRETDRIIKEISLESKETDRKMKETDRIIKEISALIKESSLKADKYFAKTKELDRNWGKLVESQVAPGMVDQFKKIDMDIDGMSQRIEKQKKGKSIGIDVLLSNSVIIIPVEVKTTLNVDAVNEHIQKRLIPFKEFFPEHIDKKIYGAVAYIQVKEDADRYAYKKGLFVMTFGTNDLFVIKNDSKFIPNVW